MIKRSTAAIKEILIGRNLPWDFNANRRWSSMQINKYHHHIAELQRPCSQQHSKK